MTGSNQTETGKSLDLIDEKGAWPFITWQVFRSADGSKRVWSSRHHRKGLLVRAAADAEGLASRLLRCLWMPQQLNWWIGSIFAIGSLLFAVASVLSLSPALSSVEDIDGMIPRLGFLRHLPADHADGRRSEGSLPKNTGRL
jgi:hypothetical protein